jgi:hypothetical protein
MGLVDVYGRFWPDNIALSESRAGDWHTTKLNILKNYQFNICLENTNFDYYCTEKIWDSISSGCLPIYFGQGNRIYEDFPKDSFLDYAKFDDAHTLFEAIRDMSPQEYCLRMNRCIEVYNRLSEKHDFVEQRALMLLKIVDKIAEITGN